MQEEDDDGYELNHGGTRAVGDEPAVTKAKPTEEMVYEEFGDGTTLMDIDPTVSNEEFVRLSIERAKKLFRKEAGRADAKRANLGDIKSTRVNIPPILQQPLFSCSEKEAANTMISGNIKAIVPLFREKLRCEDTPDSNPNLVKFQRGQLEPLYEKRIFGVLTAH